MGKKKVSRKWIWAFVFGVIFIGVLFFLYGSTFYFPPGREVYETRCRVRATPHCIECHELNWTGTNEADNELQECTKEFYADKIPEDLSDCSAIKQFCREIAGVS